MMNIVSFKFKTNIPVMFGMSLRRQSMHVHSLCLMRLETPRQPAVASEYKIKSVIQLSLQCSSTA